MSTSSSTATPAPASPPTLPALLTAWLVAGTLDISYVIVVYDLVLHRVHTERMLQGIAFSILGRSTYDGGWATALLGLGLHFCVALSVTLVFFLFSRRFPALVRRPFLWGPIYGVGVYVVMNFGIVPLTLIGWRTPNLQAVVLNVIPLVLCIGLTIALILRRLAR